MAPHNVALYATTTTTTKVHESADRSHKEAEHLAGVRSVQEMLIQQTPFQTVQQMFKPGAADWDVNM